VVGQKLDRNFSGFYSLNNLIFLVNRKKTRLELITRINKFKKEFFNVTAIITSALLVILFVASFVINIIQEKNSFLIYQNNEVVGRVGACWIDKSDYVLTNISDCGDFDPDTPFEFKGFNLKVAKIDQGKHPTIGWKRLDGLITKIYAQFVL
jgi:hypothetical protein